MQVSQVTDHVTHAVIGAKSSEEFGIAQSAEFFNILSNTLYSDKSLAVIREVLCNAWDIHIETGRTGTPVDITLNDSVLIIRDYGTGIAPEDMKPVYATYGNSTKKLDGNVTGGFGLGSKAPFAYTDHFEVTSFYEGKKTIYSISKSSAEVGGKPSIQTIVSVPTTETGLQVSINIKDHKDVHTFRDIIERIASNGEMNVMMNGKKIETVPFSEAGDGFLITSRDIYPGKRQRVYIRYGNVVYPIEEHFDYASEMDAAIKLVNKADIRQDYYRGANNRLILQAQPDTISVTPSRESLSMTDHTIKTISNLLQSFVDKGGAQLYSAYVDNAKELTNNIFLTDKPALLFDTSKVPAAKKLMDTAPDFIVNFDQVSKNYLSRQYPDGYDFSKTDIENRLRAMIQFGYGNTRLVRSFYAELLTNKHGIQRNRYGYNTYKKSNWFVKNVFARLQARIDKEPELDINKLFVYGPDAKARKNYDNPDRAFTKIAEMSPRTHMELMPFVRDIVILSYNRIDVHDRAEHFPALKHWFGSSKNTLAYITPRTTSKVEAARAFFKRMGMYVIDLTVAQKWESPTVVEVEPKAKPYKAKPAGLPQLSDLFITTPKNHIVIDTSLAKAEDIKRIIKPEFVVKIGDRNGKPNFPDYNPEASNAIIRLFGEKGGIVVNDNQLTKYKLEGAKEMTPWIIERLNEEFATNPRISLSQANDVSRSEFSKLGLNYYEKEVMGNIMHCEELAKHYGVDSLLTKEDNDYLTIFNYLYAQNRYSHYPLYNDVQKIHKLLVATPINPKLIELGKLLSCNKLAQVFGNDLTNSILTNKSTDVLDVKNKQNLIDLMIYAIEG